MSEHPPPKITADWENIRSRDALSAENLDLVRSAFSLPDRVVFGWHYYYGGGGSGTLFCFSDFDRYYRELDASRPGDHFTVYSRNAILNKAICRVGEPGRDEAISFLDLPIVLKEALRAGKEICFLSSKRISDPDCVECNTGILWDLTDEEIQEELGLQSGRSGELLFFPLEKLDEDEAGQPITTVSPGKRRRVNALVDGKRANDTGLTPSSGPY